MLIPEGAILSKERAGEQMLIGSKDFEALETHNPDVIVIGAGAVGLTLAIKLARAHRRVLLLEAGPAGLVSASQSLFEAASSIGRKHDGLSSGRFRMLGGTSNFWGGQLVPFGSHIFEPRPWLGEHTAWPIKADDIAPYTREIYDLLGMSKVMPTDEAVIARMGATMPRLDPRLRYFFSRWVPEPNFAVLFGAELRSSEHLRCVTEAHVSGFEVEGPRVTGVQVINSVGSRRVLRAPHVVLANGTIEIARLLLAPLTDGTPAPWGSNQWVGRGFIDHLDITAGRIRITNKRNFSDAFENVVFDGIKYQPKVLLTPEAQDGKFVDIGAHLIFNSSYADHYNNAKIFLRGLLTGNIDRDWKSYPAKAYDVARFAVPMAWRYLRSNRIGMMADQGIDLRLSVEQIMIPEARVRMGKTFDALGLPVVELDWRVDGRELETMAHFTDLLAQSLQGSGVAEIDVDPKLAARDPAFLEEARDTNHHMGMARMAESPAEGVVDRNLCVFGTSNLFVAGAAVYPSSGFPNPTLTAMALAQRLGSHLIESRA